MNNKTHTSSNKYFWEDTASFSITALLLLLGIAVSGALYMIKSSSIEYAPYFWMPVLGAIIIAFKRHISGWFILFIHVVYLLSLYPQIWYLDMRFDDFYTPIATGVAALTFVVLLTKASRQLFHIHQKEIVVALCASALLIALSKYAYSEGTMGEELIPNILYALLIIYGTLFIVRNPAITASNWSQYMEGLIYDADTYYTEVQKKLEEKNVRGIGYKRVMLYKRGVLSSKREYLRISFEDVVHDISFFPFALGSFASSWSYLTLSGAEAMIFMIPHIGGNIHRILYPDTYYIKDNRAMIQQLIHEVQLEIVNELLNSKGLRQLTDAQQTPTRQSLFER